MGSFSVNPDEWKRRLAICRACPKLKITPRGLTGRSKLIERCGQCGCPLVSRKVVGCPLKKF